MWGSRLVIGLMAATVTVSTATACSRPNEAGGDLAPASSIGLVVKNQNFYDMDVYAVSQGLATRVGTVTGNSSRTFTLHPSMSQDLRIVATPIGGNGRASSGNVQAGAGQTIEFTIGSTLSHSSVIIR